MNAYLAPWALLALAFPATARQLPPPPVPPGNPTTLAKHFLGKALFWDEQLSATRTMACGTCHFPEYGGSDRRSAHFPEISTHPGADGVFGTADDIIGSAGVISSLGSGMLAPAPFFGLEPQVTSRKAPSFINAGYAPLLFWDGRASGIFLDPLTGTPLLTEFAALESQAVEPPLSGVEMGHAGIQWSEVTARIQNATPLALASEIPPELHEFVQGETYASLFTATFDTPGVTPARIAMALASYQRELVSDQAKVDSFPTNFTELEMLGAFVFDFHGGCARCHSAPVFSDHSFRNIGLRPIAEDLGRGAITGNPADDGKFKVPSLRNAELRSPFFHTGGVETLEEVVEFYDRGGDFTINQDPLIVPLNLTPSEKEGLVAYLKTFTDDRVHFRQPPFDRPTLYTETNRVPILARTGTPGSAGAIPAVIAIDPPSVTNPSFTVGVKNALGGAPAVLVTSSGLSAPQLSLGALGKPTLNLWIAPPYSMIPAGPLSGQGPGEGYGALVFDLTLLGPEAVGTRWFGQWLVLDRNSPNGMASASEVFELTFF